MFIFAGYTISLGNQSVTAAWAFSVAINPPHYMQISYIPATYIVPGELYPVHTLVVVVANKVLYQHFNVDTTITKVVKIGLYIA